MNYFKLKFLLLFFALAVAIPPAWAETVTDVLTLSTFGVSGTTYTDVSGKKATSDAVYAGNLAGGNDAIQLRTDKSTSGIITTESGGKVKSIKITFNSNTTAGRIVNVYGKSSAYTAASELYTTTTRGDAIGSLNIDAGNTGTITIPEGKEYSYIGIKSSKNAIYLDKIEIEWETEGGSTTEKVATPTFSPAGGSYTEAQNVTISCATDGATIHYTTDGTEPTAESPVYSTAITVGETMTIKAIAMKDDMDNSAIASATYTFPNFVSTFADANELATKDGVEFQFTGNAFVTYKGTYNNQTYVWLREKDATEGGAVLFQPKNASNLTQEAVLNPGWTAKAKIYSTWLEYTDADNIEVGNGSETVTAFDRTGIQLADGNVNEYIAINNVKITSGPTSSINYTAQYVDNEDITYTLRNMFGATLVNGKTYNIVGTVGKYNNTIQVYPTAVTVVETPGVPEITVDEETLTINDKDENNTFTVTGSNLIDNVGVTASEGFSTNVTYLENYSGSAEGTVKVTYTGRDLYAEGTVVMGTDKDDTGEDITETVNVTYQPEIYLYGDLSDNNHDDWGDIADGQMERNGDVYSKTITLNEKGFLLFARKTGETYGWDKNRLFFGPKTDGNNWLYVADKEDDLDLDPSGQYHPFELPAGEYTITINAETKKFNIAKTEPINACPAVIEFKNNYNQNGEPADGTTNFASMEKFLEAVGAGSGFIQSANWSYLYPGSTGLKFSSSKQNGFLTINLKPLTSGSWRANKIIVNAKSYGSDQASFTINDGTSFSTTNEFADYELTVDNATALESITIAATKRIYVKSITIMHECGDEPVVETVATPTFEPAPQEEAFTTVQNVTITCATVDAAIHYTTDGTDPTAESPVYSQPIVVNDGTTTIKAIAMKEGMTNSEVASATYTVNLPTLEAPTFDHESNIYDGAFEVTIVAAEDATIYYTTDGTEPTAESAVYKARIPVNKNMTIKAIAVKEGYKTSAVATAEYQIKVAKPTFSPVPGTFDAATQVSIVCGTEGATIHYTTDGNDPTAESSVYSKAIAVNSGTMTIKAIAIKEDMTNSDIAEGVYTIKQNAGLDFDTKQYNLYVGDEFTAPTLEAPEGLTVTYESNNTDVAEVNAKTGAVTIKAAGEATITARWEATDTYTAGSTSYTITVENKPVVETDLEGNNLDLVAVVGESKTGKIIVSGENLKGDITLTLNDTKGVFAIDVTSIAKEDAIGEVTVTYTPKAATGEDFDKATVTIKSTDAETVTVNLTGMATLPDPVLTVNPDVLDMGTDATGTFTVTGQNLTEDVTVTVTGENATKFTVEPATITMADAMVEGGKTVTVTYKGTSTEDEYATITVKSGNEKKEVIVTARVLPTPEIIAEPESLTMAAKVGQTPATATFTVMASDLRGDITLTMSESDVFKITPPTIAKADMTEEGVEVTVTYTPTQAGNDNATITIASEAAESVTVTLAGTANLPDPEIIAEPENLKMTAVVGQTPATATFTVMASDLRGDITLTMSESDVFTIEPASIAKANMTEDGVEVTVTYKPTQAGNDNAIITIASEAAESVTVTLAGTATVPEVVAMPTFSLVAGSYTGPQTVIIYCATEDATISYSTDGGQTWTKGNTVNVDKDMTIMAKAEKNGMTVSTTASATYVIITEETPVTVNIETGYYQIKNLGNGLYANVAGRKTLNFTDEPADKAGTVIYVDVENDGTVKSLRSQAADLQRYADRAMSYVPEVVKIVAQKLNADGSGEILGETGLNKILDKFNECFDHNLHVEQAEGGYRLYGKTPSMQPVVEFYRENKDKVEAKLPNLEAFINSALDKLKAKIGGSSVFTEFKLLDIWDKMGGTLTKPVDDASTMAFYREVLNNKNYVWDFAYQTAMIYVNNLMSHPRWPEVEDKLGEYAQYIDKIKQIRPEFKYYIVQKDGKPDFISEGNKDIIDNNPRTIWTLEPRTGFTVNFPEANKHNGEYVTTLYTDFAYTLPKGVTAYTVTEVSTQGVATLTALEGTIPAQTPVLLKSTAAGPQTVTLSTEAGTAPADNLLVGPDYLIKHYEFKTPQVVDIFNFIKDKLPGFYDEYVAQYEYLMLKTAGTVGNKYFWNVNSDLAGLKDDCIVRSLAVDENGTLAFSDHWTTETNKAFLVDDANNPQDVIKLPSLRGDINKDGVISIIDVTALIDILLDLPARTYLNPTDTYPKGLDYEAADVNENKDIEITDVTTLIDILLNMPDQPAQGSGN